MREIPVHLLVDHPENSNYMAVSVANKLKRHIEETGRYEPLTVRPHPSEVGKYEVINGHNRLRVLRALKCERARCVIWELDDRQARLYLATLNRLCGREMPERRALLVGNLLNSFSREELLTLLPDDKKQMEMLGKLADLDEDEKLRSKTKAGEVTVPFVLSFMLTEQEHHDLNLALDLIIASEHPAVSRGKALGKLALIYLKHQAGQRARRP